MNRDNVLAAIKVMERVRDNERAFNMVGWQMDKDGRVSDVEWAATEAAAQECGMVCCFGGWLALSPEWQAQGGTVVGPIPTFPTYSSTVCYGAAAVAEFLDIDLDDAEILTATYETDEDTEHEYGYGKMAHKITPQDVIDKLNELLCRGTLK